MESGNPRRQGQTMTEEEKKAAQAIFLDSFRMNANVRMAAMKAGIHRSTFYHWLEHDVEFAVEYADAEKDANDVVRAAIFQRAVIGVDEPVVSMGRIVYDENGKMVTVKRSSDALLMRLAQARMAEYRNETKVEHSGTLDISGAKESLLGKLAARIAQESSDA